MNIKNILNQGKHILKINKIPNPQLDSELLLSEAINKAKEYIVFNPKKNLDGTQLKKFNNLIERRKKGEPIAYLVNKKEFYLNPHAYSL